MKKTILILSIVWSCFQAKAQAPEDVLRYSYFPQQGTARNMAIGGAMGSLGGDLTALFTNPAGLGFYKTSELVLSPGLNFNKNKANYRGDQSTVNKSSFNLGTSGIIGGMGNNQSDYWQSQAFSFGINQTANFSNSYYYKGLNDYSSGSEQYAEEISNSGQPLEYFTQKNTSAAFGSALAYNTYLVDTFSTTNGILVKGLPEFLLQNGTALQQEKRINTSGGIYELALGYAANHSDKFYLGGSIGVPIVSYTRNTFYREADATDNINNNFGFYQLDDKLTTKGIGVNGKLGLIFKPGPLIRVGLAVHTPTFYSLTDEEYTTLTTNTEGYAHQLSNTSGNFLDQAPQTKYSAVTPWKAIASASYVFREISDTRQQRGFITADVEYIGYKSATFHANGSYYSAGDETFYNNLKSVINASYKNALNFRLGGELKFNTWLFRLGGAYYSSPYQDAQLKSNFIQASGGIGYRNHGIFIDLTYVASLNKDVNFPYRLSDKDNTFAAQNNNRSNVLLTVGFKI